MGLATENRVKFSRIWEMPNANTFTIPSINRLIHDYLKVGLLSIDPFSNTNKIAAITNDLNPECKADYNMDALDFLNLFEQQSIDITLFDPPYSSRQVSECYKKLGQTVNMETTQSAFWTKLKQKIAHITKPNGIG